MKHCPKCKKLYLDNDTHCKECKNKGLVAVEDKKTSVFLCNCNASQREFVMNALRENNIACSYESQSQPNSMAMEGFNIIVPFGMYKQAVDVAVGIGAMDADEEIIQNIDVCQNEKFEKDTVQAFEEMSPAKRTTVRLLSALALIVLFSLVIFGVDYVMAFIKNLFI